jgi:hypothetical protein
MDETVTTTPATSSNGQNETATAMSVGEQDDIATIPLSSSIPDLSLQESVCGAAAFGWGIVELLGRCFLLSEEAPAHLDWDGTHLVLLQQVYTPREKIRELMTYIGNLSNDLSLSSCAIDDEKDDNNGRTFVVALKELVKQFCEYQPVSPQDTMFDQLRGKINKYLFFWDLQVNDALQDRATAVAKAYQVGRTLAGLRWYMGLQDQPLDGPSVVKVYQEYIPILAPYISPYASAALVNSVKLWWQAITNGQVKPGPDGMVPEEMCNQADIWFSLLTNERAALSYVPPALIKKNSHYTGKVLRLYAPFFIGGTIVLIVILALVLVVVLSHYDLLSKGIAAAAGFIAASGVTHMLGSNLSGFLQKATTDVEATKGTVIGSIRETTEQQETVESTYIAPGSAGPQSSTQRTKTA